MGKEELVYFDFFNQEVCAVLQNDDSDFALGQEISVEFKKRGIFVFNNENNRIIIG